MKKAKVMLLTIAVLTTVGAALAFKTQKLGSSKYCWIEAQTEPPASACIKTVSKALVDPFTTGTKIYYTTTTDLTQCGQLACPNVGQTPFED